MKKIIYSTITFVILIFMVTMPLEAVAASKTGLLLWFNTIIPTLLPFIILSNLIIYLDAVKYITFWIAPILNKCLSVSKEGSYAVLTGFLCGYPMGAKVTADLVKSGKVSLSEGNYLLLFCNNVSPMFIISYIVASSLGNPALTKQTLIILYLSPLLCAIFFRLFYRDTKKEPLKTKKTASVKNERQPVMPVNFKMIDTCIMNSFETITKLGGYIILFSIISAIAALLPLPELIHYIVLGSIEITNGIQTLADSTLSAPLTYIFILAAASFGGFSSIAQTESMVKDSGLSIKKYFIAKLLNTAITIGLAAAALKFTS